jgi:hypothetical protein
MNPQLSLEYSTAHRQDLLDEFGKRSGYHQVGRLVRAARRAARAEERTRQAELRLRNSVAVAPHARLDARG